jgi:quercetin dioxygenase-like cupin family protein
MAARSGPLSLSLAVFLLLLTTDLTDGQAQERYDARSDLKPRVIRRADGQKRFFPDGRFILLKVGPENSQSGYLFMGYEDLPPGTSIPRHRHEIDEEIILVQRGSVLFFFAADSAVGEAGDVMFLPPGNFISARSLGPDTASIFFVFPRAGMERCFQLLGRGEGESPGPETAEELEAEHRHCLWSY